MPIGEKMRELAQKRANGPLEYGIVRSKIGEKKGAEEWYADMHTNTNIGDYTADSPAGYTVALEDDKKVQLSGDGIRPPGQSIIADHDSVGELKDIIGESSNEEEWMDGAELEYKKNVFGNSKFVQLSGDGIRPPGQSEITDHDSVGELKEMIGENSNEEEWKDGIEAEYKKNVGFDAKFIQLMKEDAEDDDEEDPFKSRLVDDQMGVDEVKDIITSSADEEDYVGDAPKDYIKQVGIAPVKP